jgi:hypothetical protein
MKSWRQGIVTRTMARVRGRAFNLLFAHVVASYMFWPIYFLIDRIDPPNAVNTYTLASPILLPCSLFMLTAMYVLNSKPVWPPGQLLASMWISYLIPFIATFWLLGWKRSRSNRWARAGLCGGCGYDVRASTDRCPECGTPIATTRSETNLPT